MTTISVTLVRSGQSAVWARVRAAVVAHRVITLFSRRYFGLPIFPRVATRRPAPLVRRAVCCWLERHALAPASHRRQFGHDCFFDVAHRCNQLSVGPRECASDGQCIRGRGGSGAARKALVSFFLARVREAWYVREGSSRISSRRTCRTRRASKDIMSDVCHACFMARR